MQILINVVLRPNKDRLSRLFVNLEVILILAESFETGVGIVNMSMGSFSKFCHLRFHHTESFSVPLKVVQDEFAAAKIAFISSKTASDRAGYLQFLIGTADLYCSVSRGGDVST